MEELLSEKLYKDRKVSSVITTSDGVNMIPPFNVQSTHMAKTLDARWMSGARKGRNNGDVELKRNLRIILDGGLSELDSGPRVRMGEKQEKSKKWLFE